MAELKGQAIDRFVRAPDPDICLALIYGPDRGRATMRAQSLSEAWSKDIDDRMNIVDLDPQLIENEPGRLAEEADSVGMFGDHKLIRVRLDDPKPLTKTIDILLERPPAQATVLVIAGDLKKGHPLRTRIERAPTAVSIPCYAADQRDIAALLQDKANSYELSVTPQVVQEVTALLGADHAQSLSEIDKLCLYALKDGTITSDHVDGVLVDSTARTLADVADMAFTGQTHLALKALNATHSNGLEPSLVTQSLLRHAQLLRQLRLNVDKGSAPDQVVQRARPPIFFRRRQSVISAVRLWSVPPLSKAIEQLDDDLVQTRIKPWLKSTQVERQVLRLASQAKFCLKTRG